MRGVNKVILVGFVGRDAETHSSNSGMVARVNIATTESWKDKNTGAKQERTEWHRVVFFGRLAEIVSEYVRKGSQLYIEGRLQTRKWQDKEGQDRYTTEIVANEMQMLGTRAAGVAGRGGDNQGAAAPAGDQGAMSDRMAGAPADSDFEEPRF